MRKNNNNARPGSFARNVGVPMVILAVLALVGSKWVDESPVYQLTPAQAAAMAKAEAELDDHPVFDAAFRIFGF